MMINEDLFDKAFRYAGWRCDTDSKEFQRTLLWEYNRLLKIEEALQDLSDQTQQLSVGHNDMTMKLVRVGEFNLIEYTDGNGDKIVAGETYYDKEYGEFLFAPRDDMRCHFDAKDMREIADILQTQNKIGG